MAGAHLETASLQCPYCWQTIELLIDSSVPHQEYIEDCSVCCQPMVVRVETANGVVVSVEAHREDE